MQRFLYVRPCRAVRTPLMHHARRSLGRHLHAWVSGQSLGTRRPGRAGNRSPVKSSPAIQALTRKYSQSSRPVPQLTKLLSGIVYEREQRFTNAKGNVDFHSFLNDELQAVKATVVEQQAKALVPFQLDAVKYADWEPEQREAYLKRLYHTLESLRRPPNGVAGHHRSAPISVHRRSSVPYRPANIDQLFKINKVHHQPQHTPTSQQSVSPRAGANSGLPSASPTSDSAGSNAQQYGKTSHSATLTQAESPSGPRAKSATSASPRSVELSEAVREFLAKPVSGPHRPIFFDLETTGGLGREHRILELGAIGDHTGRTFTSLVNTEGVSSTFGALKTHGISDAESWHPSTPVFGVVLSRFLEFVRQECSGPDGGIPVLVAHNGKSFDNRFLSQECNRWNVPIPGGWQWMDSYILAKECVKDIPGETVSRALVGLHPHH